ncbi:MAG: hypothetical protein JRI34_10490 [Deltaproteobacteria bacterium]|nr:hypothetical protein [Deltaproteobacteria bacterium]
MVSEQFDQFDILAQKVEALLAKCQEMKKINKELETLLSKKEEEIEAFKKKVLNHEHEKAQVRAKIDDVLSRIEKFEAG